MSVLTAPRPLVVWHGHESLLVLRGRAADELANPYLVHQRLLCAWPDGAAGRVLWRQVGPNRLAVRHPEPADWARAYPYPLLVSSEAGPVDIPLRAGEQRGFRLAACCAWRDPADDKLRGITDPKRRLHWLRSALDWHGARLLTAAERGSLPVPVKRGQPLYRLTRDFNGALEVVDPARLGLAIGYGIGRSKGLGCGLLCLGDPYE